MSSTTRDPTVRNVIVLAACQALSLSVVSMQMTISAIVGNTLAADPSLVTLPLSLQFLAAMLSTIPASLIMARQGRRFGFTLGALLGLGGGISGAYAIYDANFAVFCLSSVLIGSAAGHALYYRFAAADTASEAFKPRAISLVLAGGVVAAIAGPEIAKRSRDLLEPLLFAGTYLAITLLFVALLLLLRFIRIPLPPRHAETGSGRPLLEIVRQPRFLVAVLCSMVGYGSMNLIMVATPLAMIDCFHPFEAAATVIQFHVLGMYGPSFFTGSVIGRIGVLRTLAIGVLLMAVCVAVNLSGVEVMQFAIGLLALGLGWNLLFVGGSTLLTETYRPEEKAKVQAVHDFVVFGVVTLTAFTSGALYSALGWEAVNLGVVVPLLITLAAVVWLSQQQKPSLATPHG